MNSDPNSDSKQCSKSKLGQVHNVHTPMAQAAHTLLVGPAVSWCTRRRVVAFPRSYRSLCPAVSKRYVVTQGRVTSPFLSRYKIYIATVALVARALRALSLVLPLVSQPPASYRGALLRCIATLARCIKTQSHPPQPRYNSFYILNQGLPTSRYKLCIAASSLGQAMRRVVGHLDRVTRTVGCIVAVPGRVAPSSRRAQACVPAQPAVCHNIACCIVTQF